MIRLFIEILKVPDHVCGDHCFGLVGVSGRGILGLWDWIEIEKMLCLVEGGFGVSEEVFAFDDQELFSVVVLDECLELLRIEAARFVGVGVPSVA